LLKRPLGYLSCGNNLIADSGFFFLSPALLQINEA